jgi:cytochrome c peroxidase
MGKNICLFCIIFGFGLLTLVPQGHSQSAATLKKQEETIREAMIQITKELGTTCTECHQVNNFKDDSKPSFKTALKHLKLVSVLKANGMDGITDPVANCFVCHRGELHPPAKMTKAE